jgi:hypothetical protein
LAIGYRLSAILIARSPACVRREKKFIRSQAVPGGPSRTEADRHGPFRIAPQIPTDLLKIQGAPATRRISGLAPGASRPMPDSDSIVKERFPAANIAAVSSWGFLPPVITNVVTLPLPASFVKY